MRTLRWSAPSAVVVAAMLVAGCGGGSSGTTSSSPSAGGSAASSAPVSAGPPPAAATLAKQVHSAMANATSVHISASLAPEGNKKVALSLSMTRSGDEFGQAYVNNAPITVLVTRGHTYLKVTAGALKALGLPAAACALMCGKYVKMTAKQAKSMLNGASWSDFVSTTNSLPDWSYVRTVTVNGQPAWEMKVADGSTAFVAAQGTPYLLRLTRSSQHIDFTQWNSVAIPPPPSASQVVDLSQLTNL